MAKKKSVPTPAPAKVVSAAAGFAAEGLSEASGRAALARITALVSGLAVTPATAPKVNQRAAASTTLAMLGAIDDLKLLPRLLRLAEHGELDGAALGRLPDLAHAAWYLRHQLDHESAVGRETKIPESLAVQAQDLRSRLLALLEFVLADDADVAAELVAIRQGSGYQDLAGDLASLGKLVTQHRQKLAQAAPLHYRAGDAAAAAQVAAQIVAELGSSLDEKSNKGQLVLLWQVTAQLAADYEDVAGAARFLCRKQPAAAARFPNLFTASKRSRSPRSEAEPGPVESGEPKV